MSNIFSDGIKGLLGSLGELRLYNRKEANEAMGVAKHLAEHTDSTIDHLRAQRQIIRSAADIRVEELQTVVVEAEATTDVAVATADAVEVLAEKSQIFAAAEQRVRTVAANVTPLYAAMLSGNSSTTAPQQQLPAESQPSFLQLPHRR